MVISVNQKVKSDSTPNPAHVHLSITRGGLANDNDSSEGTLLQQAGINADVAL